MAEQDGLAERFEEKRTHLRAVAYRMLGTVNEAEDAVQEAWLRLSRADTREVDNLGGWLTTVVARVCLDMLRSRKSRREDALDLRVAEPAAPPEGAANPEQELLVADSVGLALLMVLDTLAPAERLAFVLHDLFAVPFESIAPIVQRTPAATRQLASRARRRVQGSPSTPEADVARQRRVVEAFLAASRGGDFSALLSLLDPDVVFRADAATVSTTGSPAEIVGAEAVAKSFLGRAQAARPALVAGAVGVVVPRHGRLFIALEVSIVDDKIVAIQAVSDPERLREMDLAVLSD